MFLSNLLYESTWIHTIDFVKFMMAKTALRDSAFFGVVTQSFSGSI